MPPRKKKTPESPVSKTELVVLKVLWEQGPRTAREIHGELETRGSSWAYTTVLTLLQRLQAKGYVSGEKEGIAYTFSAAVSRQGLLSHRLHELADQLAGGMSSPLVHALVEDQRFTEEEIESFRRLLDDLEPRVARSRKKKRR